MSTTTTKALPAAAEEPSAAATAASGRRYRSKKQRPCDLCRYRKIQCKIHTDGGACELCLKLDRACTFVLGPLSRTYRRAGAEGSAISDDHQHQPLARRRRQQQQHQGRSPPLSEGMVTRADHHDDAQGLSANGNAMDVDGGGVDLSGSFWMPHELELSPLDGGVHGGWAGMDFGVDPALSDGHHHHHQQAHHHHSPQSQASHESGLIHDGTASSTASLNMRPSTGGTTQARSPSSAQGFTFNTSPRRSVPELGATTNNHAAAMPPSLHQQRPSSAANSNHLSPSQQQQQLSPNTTAQPRPRRRDWPIEMSLDSQEGYSHELIGLSSESDPYFLRHYAYNANDTYPMYRLHFRQFVEDASMPARREQQKQQRHRRLSDDMPPRGAMPVQFVLADEEIWKDHLEAVEGPLLGDSTERDDRELLDSYVPKDLGERLLRLYIHFVHPRYPVLSLADLDQLSNPSTTTLPIGLRAAALALAVPFTFLDDELSVSKGYLQVPAEHLWALAHRSLLRATARGSHLSSLQLCLLLLQTPPDSYVAADPPSLWALSCTAVALAESLGVNVDPTGWKLPRGEVMLRRRLWWFTYAAHTWLAVVCSRPSHLHEESWDVGELRTGDFEGEEYPDGRVRELMREHVPICLAQCGLALIAADVLKEFYTLRATRTTPALPALLSRAQLLRTRIESWRQTLPLLAKPASDLTEAEFEIGASLRISHLTLEILVFRALLRPLACGAGVADGGGGGGGAAAQDSNMPISTIFENCYTCARVVVDVVSGLKAQHFAGFWHPYVRYQLCYVSTFILVNLAQSGTRDLAARHLALLGRWRDTLRIQARAWPLAKLAAMRLDAIFWKGLLSVVHGAGPDSPAVVVLREQGVKGAGER